ncbi:MAG TPA: PAS domain-containing protein [bacterium (Candidatus Stahlbacteria)]|nr:PAS domain-containing protein [Candidatus Stahlbacteria bacterium]
MNQEIAENLIYALADGVVTIDSELRIVSFNLGAQRITGYTPQQAYGLPCRDIFRANFCDKDCPVKRTIRTGEAVSGARVDIVAYDGRKIPIYVNTTPLKDTKGKVIGAVQTFRNILELHTLVSELVKEKNRLLAILESIGDGVFTVDTNWKITSFNRAAERITGFSKKEAIGKPCHSIFRSNICTERCPLRQTLETHKPIANFEMEILSKTGKKVPISVGTALLIDEEGEIAGGVEVFRDLSPLKHLSEELKERYSFGNIIGKNPKMQEIYDLLKTVSETSSTVLIQGETGTGKELVARAIHYNSTRHDKPFIKVSCAALPETLLESELFGYMKGAFTDAVKDKPGRFELANKGTIFLDEVGEIPKSVQAKLLRVLEEQEFERLGGTKTIKVDVRIIAATNKDLREAINRNEFREDLYYRLNVVSIHLPPLRERSDDIPLLVNHFIEKFNQKTGKHIASVSQDAMDILIDYHWPGNVRQLENAIEHAFVHCQGKIIQPQHLPDEIVPEGKVMVENALAAENPFDELEKQVILETLRKNNWDTRKVAHVLQISRTTLWRKLKKYGIRRS